MPNLKISIPHTLSQPEALTRIQNFLPELKVKHANQISDLTEKWSNNTCDYSFTVKGFKISGSLTVDESFVVIAGSIPWVVVPFRSKIEAIVREEAESLLK